MLPSLLLSWCESPFFSIFQWPEAVEMYREATRSWTEHEETFRTDALQVRWAHNCTYPRMSRYQIFPSHLLANVLLVVFGRNW